MRYPNLFLAGAPKCGTTSLAYYLGQHSQIYAPIKKEPIFFGSDLHSSEKRRSEDSYLAFYDGWNHERYALDGSTHYFYSNTAAHEIADLVPDARIMVMVRNPIDATYSMFHQLRFNGEETLENFSDFLDAETSRARSMTSPNFGFAESFQYSRVFSFAENIQRFEEVFGTENTRAFFLEDLERNPREFLQAVCAYLEIDAEEVEHIDFEMKNTAKRVSVRWLNTIAVHPPLWMGYLSKPLLSQNARTRLRNLIAEKNTRPTTNPPMDTEVRQRLAEHFRPEIERLSKHLLRDLSHWV